MKEQVGGSENAKVSFADNLSFLKNRNKEVRNEV